jgi:hypothetical protein
MAEFILTLDLSDHQHPHNQRAQHMTVLTLLDLAKQAIGSDNHRSGKLSLPSRTGGDHQHVGTWEFRESDAPAKGSAA